MYINCKFISIKELRCRVSGLNKIYKKKLIRTKRNKLKIWIFFAKKELLLAEKNNARLHLMP